jgi:hypothetical protein
LIGSNPPHPSAEPPGGRSGDQVGLRRRLADLSQPSPPLPTAFAQFLLPDQWYENLPSPPFEAEKASEDPSAVPRSVNTVAPTARRRKGEYGAQRRTRRIPPADADCKTPHGRKLGAPARKVMGEVSGSRGAVTPGIEP